MNKFFKDLKLFEKRKGRDKTAKMFWNYVRNLIFLFIISVISLFAFEPYQAVAIITVDILIAFFMGCYSIISLRLRKIEEHFEE